MSYAVNNVLIGGRKMYLIEGALNANTTFNNAKRKVDLKRRLNACKQAAVSTEARDNFMFLPQKKKVCVAVVR